jgi:hypothetical protein
MTENTEKALVLIRNFLFKWFIVGYLILLVSAIIYIFVKDWAAGIAESWYNISPDTYYNIVMWFYALAKLFLITMVLSPALALHWLIVRYRKKILVK